MKHAVIPIFIPHKGCPFDCIYCNQKTISGQKDDVTSEQIKQIIEGHLLSIDNAADIEIGFYGGSFTGIDKNQQIEYLKIANEYIYNGRIGGIRLSTRPDYISKEILEYLVQYNVKIVELGVQSFDEDVLAKSCRGHSSEDVYKACKLIKESGINLGIQTMIGLPGDNVEKDLYTAAETIKLSPALVRIYPTLVIRNTYLEKMYLNNKYNPLSIDDAVDLCAQILDMYRKNGINVIRIGLQPTDTIQEGMDVVAGPFHPAFRQLVEARLALQLMDEYIKKNNLADSKAIEIYTGNNNISNVVGQKKSNIKYLKGKYKYDSIRVKADQSLGAEIIIRNGY